jgi:GT2 family glycosyltransferase
VIDNGSEKPPQSTTHRLPENLGFTRGMYEAWRIASSASDYAAYWFLNSDVGFEYGDDVLSNLADLLFSSDEFAQISPQFNSPHKFMEKANGPPRRSRIWSRPPRSSRRPPSKDSASGISISLTAGAWITITAFGCGKPGLPAF